MLKKHGEVGFERLIDAAFEAASYLASEVEKRDGFELIMAPQYTNICFYYIPTIMRERQRDEKWMECISKVTALIKERMMMNGNLMIGYQPLPSQGLKNFFRMVVTAQPKATNEMMDFVLNQIVAIGDNFEFFDEF